MVGCDGSWVGQGELENAGYFQWWHQERRREWGGTKAFLSLQAVSGDSVVHALFLLPIQHVIREKVEGGRRRGNKDFGQLEKGSVGYMQVCLDHILIF